MFLLFYSYIRGGLQYTDARGEKYSSKLDIFRSLIRHLRYASNILSLAVKNIQASLIFFARLFVYLWLIYIAVKYFAVNQLL